MTTITLFLGDRAEGTKVKFGIEIDFFPGKEKEIKEFIDRYPFDYVIGSVHWIDQWGIDLSEIRRNGSVEGLKMYGLLISIELNP